MTVTLGDRASHHNEYRRKECHLSSASMNNKVTDQAGYVAGYLRSNTVNACICARASLRVSYMCARQQQQPAFFNGTEPKYNRAHGVPDTFYVLRMHGDGRKPGEGRSEEPSGLEGAAGGRGLRDALVADDGHVSKVGLHAERGVKRVRLRARLRRRCVRRGRRGLARGLRRRVRAARARELLADEARDHADRIRGAWVHAEVLVMRCFGRGERGAYRGCSS